MGADDKAEYRQLRDTIYTFFYYSNRPAALSEIMLQFKNAKKPVVQAVLDDLVGKEKIFVKEAGKSKFYCLAQDMVFEINEDIYTDEIDAAQDQTIEDKTLRYLKWDYERHVAQLERLKAESRELDRELDKYKNQLSVEELKRGIKDMTELIKKHSKADKREKVTATEFTAQKKLHAGVKKELAERKRIVRDIVDSISEGCGIDKKLLSKEAGLEEL